MRVRNTLFTKLCQSCCQRSVVSTAWVKVVSVIRDGVNEVRKCSRRGNTVQPCHFHPYFYLAVFLARIKYTCMKSIHENVEKIDEVS